MLAILASAALASPATAAGPADTLEDWLTAFNSGERAAIDAFYAERFVDPNALRARNLRGETCGFDLVRIESPAEASLSALVAERCFPA